MKKLLLSLLLLVSLGYGYQYIPMNYTLYIGDLNKETLWSTRYNVFILKHVADKNDTVKLDIYSHGGYVSHTMRIINAVLETEAKTLCVNTGVALSGGALIALSCDNIEAAPLSVYLFHRPYYELKGIKILADENTYAYKLTQLYMELNVFPRFTDQEIIDYNKGKDVTILSNEFLKRGINNAK